MDPQARIEGLFRRAQVKMVERVSIDYRGVLVVRNGWGGMVDGRDVRIRANRDFGTADMTNIAQETGDGDRLLIFRESDLGIPTLSSVTVDLALRHVLAVIRDRCVIFIGSAPEGAHWLHPLVVLPREQAGCVVFGTWPEVEALILTAERAATRH